MAIEKALNDDIQLLMVVVPNNNADRLVFFYQTFFLGWGGTRTNYVIESAIRNSVKKIYKNRGVKKDLLFL